MKIHKFGNLRSSALNRERLDIDRGWNLRLWKLKLDLMLWIDGACWGKVVPTLGHWVRRFDIDFV